MNETLNVGELQFELRRSKRRRTVGITVDRDGKLYVAAPATASLEAVRNVVEGQRFWVYTKLAEKELLFRARTRKEYVNGEGFYYLGRSYRLSLLSQKGALRGSALRLSNGRFLLQRDEAQNGKRHFVQWYTERARARLLAVVIESEKRLDASPRRVLVRDVGSRWASCGRGDTLYFHWRVVLLPLRIIEYIVFHELLHLREPHHTVGFWRLLERAMPDFPERKQWLAENGGRYDL